MPCRSRASFAEDPRWQIYVADTVTNYEIGIKGVSAGALRPTAFQVDWENPQLNTATPNWGFFVVQNGDEAESSGVELQLSGNIGDSMTYGFGWAYVDAKLTADFVSPIGALIQRRRQRRCRARRRIR